MTNRCWSALPLKKLLKSISPPFFYLISFSSFFFSLYNILFDQRILISEFQFLFFFSLIWQLVNPVFIKSFVINKNLKSLRRFKRCCSMCIRFCFVLLSVLYTVSCLILSLATESITSFWQFP